MVRALEGWRRCVLDKGCCLCIRGTAAIEGNGHPTTGRRPAERANRLLPSCPWSREGSEGELEALLS